jgi:hypothetical protein
MEASLHRIRPLRLLSRYLPIPDLCEMRIHAKKPPLSPPKAHVGKPGCLQGSYGCCPVARIGLGDVY